jgi:protein TonB
VTETGIRNHLLGQLQTRLSRYLVYPPLARSRGWEGTVLLGLRVESNGHLERIRIEHSSGYAVLDNSALNSLNRLDRLAEASVWLNGHGLDMQLPVIYRLIEN